MALADEMIKTIMKNLDCDEETAKDVIECDKRIDKGEKLFELPEELQKGAKKARNAGNCKGYTKSAEKEKKVDIAKRFLIQCMSEIAENLADNGTIDVTNPEREFTFVYKEKKYKIVLSCPRSQRGQFFLKILLDFSNARRRMPASVIFYYPPPSKIFQSQVKKNFLKNFS